MQTGDYINAGGVIADNFIVKKLKRATSYSSKLSWNWLVREYRNVINHLCYFNGKMDYFNTKGYSFPNIDTLTNNVVLQIFTSLYDAKRGQIFDYAVQRIQPTINEDEDIALSSFASYVTKNLNTHSSNFTENFKSFIEDWFVLGCAFAEIVEDDENNILNWITLDPTQVEFSQSLTGYVYEYFITRMYMDHTEYIHIYEEDKMWNRESIVVYKNTNGTTTRLPDVHTVYKKTSYCPIIMSKLNVKSGQVVGIGRGLEIFQALKTYNNIIQTLSSVGEYDLNKVVLVNSVIFPFKNEGNSEGSNLKIKNIDLLQVSAPANVFNGESIRVLETNSNPTIAFKLLEEISIKVNQAFEINRLIINKENTIMTATEASIRNTYDQTYLEIYTNHLRSSLDKFLRVAFKFYMKDFLKLELTDVRKELVKPYKKNAFNESILAINWHSTQSDKLTAQVLQNYQAFFQVAMNAIQVSQSIGIDAKQILNSLETNLNIRLLSSDDETNNMSQFFGIDNG